jgi:hypothetical protein
LGYLPDSTLSASANDYKIARETLKATLTPNQLIDVFGVSSRDDREEKLVSKFTINREPKVKGDIALAPSEIVTSYMDGENQRFRREKLPEFCYDIPYTIRLITDHTAHDRIMSHALDNSLGDRRYLKPIDEDGNETADFILVEFTGGYDLSSKTFVERIFKYVAKDVWLQDSILVRENIFPMDSVHWNGNLSTFASNMGGNNTPDSSTEEAIIIP